MDQLANIVDVVMAAIPGVLSILGGFAVLATLTPNTADDAIIQKILDVVNFLGGNFGKATNEGK